MKKIIAFILIIVAILNMVLLALSRIPVITFWIILAVLAFITFKWKKS